MNKVKLNEICQFLNGYAFKSKQYVDDGIRIIRIANVQKGKIIDDAPCFYPSNTINEIEKYLLSENDLLISLTGNVGRVGLLTRDMLPAALNQRVSCIRILNKNVVFFKYLYYYLQQNAFERDCIKASNGVAQLNLSTKWLENYQIFLPSLEEQQLIVTKIEELFSKLDKGVEELNKIKEQLKIYRQAVLKEAFSGKLTKNKKIERDVYSLYQSIKERNNKKFQSEEIQLYELPSGWMWVNIGDITDGVEYGSSKKSQKSGLVPVLRMGNIQNGAFDWSDLAYSSDEDEINKYLLKNNDVLFNRTNSPELVGKTAIYKEERKAIFAGYLIRLNQYDVINAKYLNYYLNSFTAKMYGNLVKTDGVNQSNINGKKLCSYPFPLCTTEEQDIVVKEIEARLSVCDKIEQTVNESLQKAESLRQSILKQAFEGKL